MARLDRYRAYFLLMDFTTVLTVISLIHIALNPVAAFASDAPQGYASTIRLLALVLPGFLIFASFMRDEYAELCWQRAAAATVKGLVIIPIIALFAAGVVQGYRDAEAGITDGSPESPLAVMDGQMTLAIIWALLLTLFILAFQWHRWRGSR